MTRLAFAVLSAVALLPPAPGQEKKDELKLSKEEQELIDLTNAERKKAELPPLAVNPKLMAAARAHAENMARQEKLEHTLDDKDPAARVTDAGYKFRTTGENVAWNADTPKEAVKDWMDSPPHRENILKKGYADIGAAVAKSKKGERYWVQVFGAELEK